jgi:3-hydroxyisobutyrate dehydrogenase
MTSNNPLLGFIGIGLMGKPMTLRLLNAGNTVYVWNRSPEKLQAVTQAGAIACSSVAELVKAVDVVILCLADTEVVEAIVRNDIASNGAPNKLLIDLSSIHPETTKQLAALLQKQCGMGWVDAPVSGGVAGAEQGNLAIMAGGSEADIAVAREVLAPLYRQLTHMGEVGSGQITKIGKTSWSRCRKNTASLSRWLCRLQTLANYRHGNGPGTIRAGQMARQNITKRSEHGG